MRGMTATRTDKKPKANGLVDLDINKAEPLILTHPRTGIKRKRADRLEPTTSRKVRELNSDKRIKPPKIPKNKSLAEIAAMDPDDPAFKHDGRPRKVRDQGSMADAMQNDRQRRANARRARARKAESTVSKAVEVLETHATSGQRRKGIDDEDLVYAEGILNLDDWDNEELIRGFRRNRDGSFGKPPKFISRDLMQQAFRALVARGDGHLKKSYMAAVEELTQLALNARSEKVKLDAIRELMERVVGKVPDRVHVATEEPWETMLADALVPVSEAAPLELTMGDDGVAHMDPIVDGVEPEPLPSGD